MRNLIVAMLVLGLAAPAWAVKKGKAKYKGGTIVMKVGKEAPFSFTGEGFVLTPKPKEGESLLVPWGLITDVEYGQQAGRRIKTAILLSPIALFSKSRKHFVTISWVDEADEGQVAVFEFDKNDIRSFLATMRAKTKREIIYLDDEARKKMGGGSDSSVTVTTVKE